MSPLTLHITGVDLDPNVVFAGLQIKPFAQYRKGDAIPYPRRAAEKYSCGGAKVDVSANEGQEQITDAIAFLKKNKQELMLLAGVSCVEEMTLDFGFYHPVDKPAIFRTFPAELLLIAGTIGIGIETSCYAVDNTCEK